MDTLQLKPLQLAAPDRLPEALPTEPELPPGYLLDGRFRIAETLGHSGMAIIYRAEDVAEGHRTVAVKVPLQKIERAPAWFARFLREQGMGAKFDHPQLVKFLPAPPHPSRPYLVMEYLPGRTLARVLDETWPLPEAVALQIASGVCTALRHMHGHGVVHCDLKPSNLMIGDDGTVRLFDFGLAAAPERGRHLLGSLRPIFGTPEYMAPEQVRNGFADERADIYSLGAILYELLTGEVPFRRDDPWESAYARLNGDPVAPRQLNPAISPAAEEIILHALQRKPQDRYPSVAAFQAELDAPEQVRITGYRDRLRAPRWRLSFQGTPITAGLVLGLSVVAVLVGMFFVLRFALAR